MDKFLQWVGNRIMCSGVGIGKRNCPRPVFDYRCLFEILMSHNK